MNEKCGAVAELRIEFAMDDSYYEEFFGEWVAVLGSGWRFDRIMIPASAVFGVACCLAAWFLGTPPLYGLGGVAIGAALLEAWKRNRRRDAWYEMCRSLPSYGKQMKLLVDDGVLVQINDYPGDPRFDRAAPIRLSPNGYLVRYEATPPTEDIGVHVSRTHASVYIPHRTITPSITRADFSALIGAV